VSLELQTVHRHTHTHMSQSAQRKHKIKLVQTLSQSHHVSSMHMRASDDMTSAILLIGLNNGDVDLYRTRLSHSPIRFHLLKRLHAHTDTVNAIHMHPTDEVLFVSASDDDNVKIWSIKAELKAPVLIKCIEHPDCVWGVKFSRSGMLLTGGDGGVLRVYGVEPLCSLRWRCKLPGAVYLVAWSPSNFIAALFDVRTGGCAVKVWDSTFHALFEHKHIYALCYNNGLSFASDYLLVCSGRTSKYLCAYDISKSKVKVTAYPYKVNRYPYMVAAVTALSYDIVCETCDDYMIRIYQVQETQLRLLATLPHECGNYLSGCVYPCTDAGYVLASTKFSDKDVYIEVTCRFNQYWMKEVTNILFNTASLPFCRDVHKLILKYLR